MKSCRIVSFILLALLTLTSAAQAAERLCVLNFERVGHPFSKMVDKVFKSQSNTLLIHEAKPLDFAACLSGDYDEVVVITHALQMDEEATRFTLGYFVRMSEERRAEFLASQREAVLSRIETLQNDFERNNCDIPIVAYENWLCTDLSEQIWKLEETLKKIRKLERNATPLHDQKAILRQVFRRLSGQSAKVKKLRIAVCEPEQTLGAYPELMNFLKANNIKVEFGPEMKFASWIHKKELVTITKKWLRKSLK